MPKLHGAKVLSGLGRAGTFTRNAMLPRSPRPQRRESRVGLCLYKITDSRKGFWISAIDLSGRVGREFRNCLCEWCIDLKIKSNSFRPKHKLLKEDFGRRPQRWPLIKLFPLLSCYVYMEWNCLQLSFFPPINPWYTLVLNLYISWKGLPVWACFVYLHIFTTHVHTELLYLASTRFTQKSNWLFHCWLKMEQPPSHSLFVPFWCNIPTHTSRVNSSVT